MLKEFAVDPRVIASSFGACRYLFSQFGAAKGRLISKFPKTWKRLAIEAADKLPDGYNKERVVEYLNGINSELLTLIASGRPYEQPGGDWLDNAIAAHKKQPFQAIICDRNDPENHLVDANDCDENTPLFAAHRNRDVKRTAHDLAQAAALLLQNCRALRLIDPYFNPGELRWRESLAAFLSLVPDIIRVECEYHILEDDKSPSTPELIRRLGRLKGVIPVGGALRIIRWKEKPGGERFHRRYVLIENAGLNYEGGLDPAIEADQTTDVTLLDRKLHRKRWDEFNLTSDVYELLEPVLVVDSEGHVSELKR